MLGFLFAFLKNPMTILSIIAAVAVLAAMFFAAPKTFAKIAFDTRTWLVVILIAMVSGYTHLSKQNTELQQKVEAAREVTEAKDDALATVRVRQKAKTKRQVERERISETIEKAEPGHAYDDALDEIAKLQAEAAPAPAPKQSLVDRLRNDRKPDGVVHP